MYEPTAHPDGTPNTVLGDVSGTVVQAGAIYGGLHHHHPSSRRPVVTLPHRFGVLPPQATSYQNRGTSQLVAEVLGRDGKTVSNLDGPAQVVVLSGLGGVGKTQLAVNLAEDDWAAGHLDLLAWVTATSREAVVSGYARLAADLIGIDDQEPEVGAARLLEWLADTTAQWLVVLDDLQSPGDLRGLWPPTTRTGRTVVTTRRRDAALIGPHRELIEVGVFSASEAEAYLRTSFANQPHRRDGAADLVTDLGCLPLALSQARAYMLDRGLSCAAYRTRLADRRLTLTSLLPESDMLPDEHRTTVAATWSLSIDQANRLEPTGLARPLLEVASLLDANGIPADLFRAPAVLRWLTTAVDREVSRDEAMDGLYCLHRLSLITLDTNSAGRTARVHALVQRATRDTLSGDRMSPMARAVADGLVQIWPEIERDTLLGQVLRANTAALTAVSGEYLWDPVCHAVLVRTGRSLGDSGLFTEARQHFRKLHVTAVGQLGADHSDALGARATVAYFRGKAGDPTGAVTALAELLPDVVRVLGAEHPTALTSRANLAYFRGKAGDPAGAVTAYEELLGDRLRVLGPDHPDTLTSRAILAYWRGEAGDPSGAVVALEELLVDALRVLGADHPNTLITRGILATWRGRSGDPAGAVAALNELLGDRLRVLGPDHPDTLTSRADLAGFRGETGDPAGAVAALNELLGDRIRVLGPGHPDTLTTRNEIAVWQAETPVVHVPPTTPGNAD